MAASGAFTVYDLFHHHNNTCDRLLAEPSSSMANCSQIEIFDVLERFVCNEALKPGKICYLAFKETDYM